MTQDQKKTRAIATPGVGRTGNGQSDALPEEAVSHKLGSRSCFKNPLCSSKSPEPLDQCGSVFSRHGHKTLSKDPVGQASAAMKAELLRFKIKTPYPAFSDVLKSPNGLTIARQN